MPIRLQSLTDPRLAELIIAGGVGIIPTDTVYGLVCSASQATAVSRHYSLKSRQRQPGTTIAASVQHLADLGFPTDALDRIKHMWPNALSVEMSAADIADYLKAGQSVMAVRIPNHPELLELLTLTGPLMTTSANTPHAPTSRTIDEAVVYFGDEVDFYVDAGDLGSRPPSTIVGYDGDTLIIYRAGAVDIGNLGDSI